jgi:rRNA maturation RNase YbeY
MISYHYETDFNLENEACYSDWINRVLESEGAAHGQIDYIFCSDQYLLGLNQKFLQHSTFTDIITFDYSGGKEISGDIFISVERVMENAVGLNETFEKELLRVMVHGLLHMLGYPDKTAKDKRYIRQVEENKIKLFHVEQ